MPTSPHIQILPSIPFATMILVEGGTFWMGDDNGEYSWEKPAHQVHLDSFYIGEYPVTQALWKAVMGKKNNPSFFKGDGRPVESISWIEIVENFLPKLNDKTRKTRPSGYSYRLPTEAEWEFAARGGLKSQDFLYAGSDQLKNVGWFRDNSHSETKIVGQKQPNELCLFDMSGNVWEWCWDWWDDKYYEKCNSQGVMNNPLGPEQGSSRVLRGGGWGHYAEDCRATDRYYGTPEFRYDLVGFRLVLSPQSVG